MPNWCSNSITIKGPASEIQALWDRAVKTDGLLSAMCPMPEDLEGTSAPSETANWYDWCNEHWGTKWDVSLEGLEIDVSQDGTAEITGYFDSAWAPPIDAYSGYSEANPQITIEAYYEEGGMCFVGYWDTAGADDHYEYDSATSDNIRSIIPEYLVDFYDLDERIAEYEEEEDEEEMSE